MKMLFHGNCFSDKKYCIEDYTYIYILIITIFFNIKKYLLFTLFNLNASLKNCY